MAATMPLTNFLLLIAVVIAAAAVTVWVGLSIAGTSAGTSLGVTAALVSLALVARALIHPRT